MGVPSVIVDEKGERIPGMVPFDMILKYPERHSKAVMHDFLLRRSFAQPATRPICQALERLQIHSRLYRLRRVAAIEVLAAQSSQLLSADFTTCQGCHMKRTANALPDYGAKNGTFASHRWLAGNTAVPFYYGFDQQLKKTIEFLRVGQLPQRGYLCAPKPGSDELIAPLGRGLL